MTTEQQRKMLECAAKACGIEGHYNSITDVIYLDNGFGGERRWWNPLTNPADCADMCAKLEIDTTWLEYERMECGAYLNREEDYERCEVSIKDHDNSHLKAWMYAATMVAAKTQGY